MTQDPNIWKSSHILTVLSSLFLKEGNGKIIPIVNYTVSHGEGGKNPLCWKQVIHFMAFTVIALIAFIWILFQMLTGTETIQRNDQHLLFYCESCFCRVLMCDSRY